ncbi:MAG TPA: hypothetical protein VGI96_20985 [Streptosporangiaceae bacterium]
MLKLMIRAPATTPGTRSRCSGWPPATAAPACSAPTSPAARCSWSGSAVPCTEQAVDYALACASRLHAHDPERVVRTHGDVHQWNVLEAPRGQDPGDLTGQPEFKLVDPAGWPAAAASTPPPAGNGAPSNGCRPACS